VWGGGFGGGGGGGGGKKRAGKKLWGRMGSQGKICIAGILSRIVFVAVLQKEWPREKSDGSGELGVLWTFDGEGHAAEGEKPAQGVGLLKDDPSLAMGEKIDPDVHGASAQGKSGGKPGSRTLAVLSGTMSPTTVSRITRRRCRRDRKTRNAVAGTAWKRVDQREIRPRSWCEAAVKDCRQKGRGDRREGVKGLKGTVSRKDCRRQSEQRKRSAQWGKRTRETKRQKVTRGGEAVVGSGRGSLGQS